MKPIYAIALIILVIQAAVTNFNTAFAGPGNPKPFTAIQPDKTKITLRVFGDEWYHYVETIDGYTVIKKQGWWVYAKRDMGGNLIPSDTIVRPSIDRTSDELRYIASVGKHLRPSEEIINKIKATIPSYKKRPNLQKILKTTTTLKIPVFLVEFPDLAHTDSVGSFDGMFNKENWEGGIGSPGSINDYYREVSYGKFGIDADVYGWYIANNSFKHYSWSHSDRWARARELTADIIDIAEADGVDFSIYDNDGDGAVEAIVIVHAGPGAAQNGDTQYIWPHFNGLFQLTRNYDGVEIGNYTMQEELQFNRHSGIGIYVHEFGHALGLPDLYDTDFSSNGIGNWGIMGTGSWVNAGRTPPHFGPWSRDRLGWITPTLIDTSSTYSFTPAETDSSAIHRINIPNSASEYFYVENRQKIGFDSRLPGSGGLLIWHIDSNKFDNADENHKWIDVEEADGLDHIDKATNRGDAGDLFPGSSGNRTFDSYSYPNSLDYNGNFSIVSVNNISDSDFIMTADVNVDGLAFFNADIRTGHAPLTVHFTDASIALSPFNAWAWDFDNDETVDSTTQNPSWTYMEPGHYTVKLEASNDDITTSAFLDNYIKVFNGESALLFDEEKQFGEIPADSTLNPTRALTAEAWINPAGWGPWEGGLARVMSKSHFYLYLQKTATSQYVENSLVLLIKDENDSKSFWNTPANSITLNEWQHVAATYNSVTKEVKIYINGVSQTLTNNGTVSGEIKDNATKKLVIGNGTSKRQTFEGMIDEVRIWGVARNEAQIQAQMNRSLFGDEAGLLGYWKMDEGSGAVLADSSHNHNHGIVSSSWIDGKALDVPITQVQENVYIGKPKTYALLANYPNPFNPITRVQFVLPVKAQVSVEVFNVLGQHVREILNDELTAGFHHLNFNASNLSSGIYFYTINALGVDGTNFSKARKMILLR